MQQNNIKIFFSALFVGMLSAASLIYAGIFFYSVQAGQAADVGISGCVAQEEVCDNGIDDDCDGLVDNDDTDECGGGGGGPCFLPGTTITLDTNEKLPIEQVKVGQRILSYNPATDEMEEAVVTNTFSHAAKEYLVINEYLEVTSNHPMYINGEWLEIGSAKVGDVILNENQQLELIQSIEQRVYDGTVYNLSVTPNQNYFANGLLAHNKGDCTPNPVRTCLPCGYLEPGFQRCTTNNGCGLVITSDIGCGVLQQCGDGIREGTEECDDGNTVNGDGCSSVCGLEQGCGNGIVEGSEQCDDDNTISGDGCSSSCRVELYITNVWETGIEKDRATINWSTNLASNSLLEWGTTQNQSCVYTGQITNDAEVTTHTFELLGLTPSTSYCYRVTSQASYQGSQLEAQRTDSFVTLNGVVEICDNNIDDDGDGLIDIEDNECACSATWECDPENWDNVECINGVQTRQCVKVADSTGRICWSNQPAPEATRSCDDQCQGVVCPAFHTINDQCQCIPEPGACGNLVCEPGDLCGCPQDCAGACIPDWQCSPSSFSEAECNDGVRRRNCIDQNGCNTTECQPPTQESCTDGCTVQCAPWQYIEADTCTCMDIVPYCPNQICEDGETHENCPQDCVDICIPNWVPTSWGACENGVQSRSYQDLNNCDAVAPPPNQRCCAAGCNVTCGACQQLDVSTQSCIDIEPCCGNRQCEGEENVYSCAVDCGIPPGYKFDLPACLDGIDNDNDGLTDYPEDPGCSSASDGSELNIAEVIAAVGEILDNPQVEAVNKVATPVLIVAVAANTFATFSFFSFASYAQYIFTQPFALLFRRRRKKYGVVYNALTKQPIDLAIVRLYSQETNKLVQSKVTDKNGRYSIIASPGKYYIKVTKQQHEFPSKVLAGQKEDVKFLDLYHGDTILVNDQKTIITANIPIDPLEQVKTPRKIIFEHYLRKVQYAVSFSAIPLAVLSAAVSPGPLTFSLLGFHTLLYFLFRRLGYQKAPKSWGVVYNKKNKEPLGRAIARIFDKQYNKLLETRVTDNKGRYAFLVNDNRYYITVEKPGFEKHVTEEIDMIKSEEDVVDFDIGLKPGEGQEVSAASQVVQPSEQVTQAHAQEQSATDTPSVAQQQEVGRQELESLMGNKTTDTKPVVAEQQLQGRTSVEKQVDAILQHIDQQQPQTAPPAEAEKEQAPVAKEDASTADSKTAQEKDKQETGELPKNIFG